MEEQGDLRSGGDVTEGLRVCRHLGPLLAPRPLVSQPRGGRGPLIAGCRCPAGVKGRRGHSRAREGAWAPRDPPANSPSPAPVAPVASPGSCHGAWSCSPGPRFAAGECLLPTRRTGGRDCLHCEGGWSSGRPRSQRSQSLLAEFRPDFRECKWPGPCVPPGGRVGQFEPKKSLNSPGRAQA